MLNEILLTQQEIKDRIQYWYSKYYNGVTRDEKEIYFSLYKSYLDLEKYWQKYDMF